MKKKISKWLAGCMLLCLLGVLSVGQPVTVAADTASSAEVTSNIKANCDPYLLQHAVRKDTLSMAGVTYTDAFEVTIGKAADAAAVTTTTLAEEIAAGYAGTIDFNLNKNYSSVSFKVAGLSGTSDAKLTVLKDEKEGEAQTISVGQIPVTVTEDVKDVSRLTIKLYNDGETSTYGVAAVNLTGIYDITDTAKAKVTIAETADYTGTAVLPEVTVTYGNQTLKKDTDYTVTAVNNIEMGEATAEVTGIRTYTGTVKKTFTVFLGTPVIQEIANTSKGISLKWNEVPAAKGYYIYRKVEGGSYARIETITDPKTITYTDTAAELAEGSLYSYVMKAYMEKTAATGTTTGTTATTGTTTTGTTTTGTATTGTTTTGTATTGTTTTGTTATGTTASDANVVESAESKAAEIYRLKATAVTSLGYNGSLVQVEWKKNTAAAGYLVYRMDGTGNYNQIAKIESNATLVYNDTDAKTAGIAYKYRIYTYKGESTGPASAAVSYYVLDRPKITSVINGDAAIKLTWEQVTNCTGYYVYRKAGDADWVQLKKITKAATVKYTDSAVESGVKYQYQIRAYKGTGQSQASPTKTIYRLTTPKVSSIANAATGIRLRWQEVTDATGYIIERKIGSGAWTRIKKITNNTTFEYIDTAKKTNGQKCQYRIYAYKGSTKSKASAASKMYYMKQPTISKITNSLAGRASIFLSTNKSASGAAIKYSTNSALTSYTLVTRTGSPVISGLSKGKTYYLKVRTYKTVSGVKYYSAWSAKKSIKITK